MAVNVWFSVIMLFFLIHHILARDCSIVESTASCDECIRCGGYWCNNPSELKRHCTSEPHHNCPDREEDLLVTGDHGVPGKLLSYSYIEKTVKVGFANKISVNYRSSDYKEKVKTTISSVNSTQNIGHSHTSGETKCYKGNCTTTIKFIADNQFCSSASATLEFVNVEITMDNIEERLMVKYNVPCACGCSKKIERNSSRCNNNGDYSCGSCVCHEGWGGESCEDVKCAGRGDSPCYNEGSNLECYGNGYCGYPCETCICFTDREGSQYFDKKDNCADLCMTITNEYDECLLNPNSCEIHGRTPLNFQTYNKDIAEERDGSNRRVWVHCNYTLIDSSIEYLAKKDQNNSIYVMIDKLDTADVAAYTPAGYKITLPLLICVAGMVAAVAATAAAGYATMRARAPPLTPASPNYTNIIGAEDCTGENPLYKPPTSSFKNPTYGKW